MSELLFSTVSINFQFVIKQIFRWRLRKSLSSNLILNHIKGCLQIWYKHSLWNPLNRFVGQGNPIIFTLILGGGGDLPQNVGFWGPKKFFWKDSSLSPLRASFTKFSSFGSMYTGPVIRFLAPQAKQNSAPSLHSIKFGHARTEFY